MQITKINRKDNLRRHIETKHINKNNKKDQVGAGLPPVLRSPPGPPPSRPDPLRLALPPPPPPPGLPPPRPDPPRPGQPEPPKDFFRFSLKQFRERSAKGYGLKRTSYRMRMSNPPETQPPGHANIIRELAEDWLKP